jgi:uncharacterized membrane protein YozB (DUF420 family)
VKQRGVARLGGHDLLLELASGGMATVYVALRAGETDPSRLVVLKRVRRHLLTSRALFDMVRDEARVGALVRHPNVIAVDDVLDASGELVLVQRYVESAPLSALVEAAAARGERLPPAVAVRVVADLLDGLAAAHDATDASGRRLDLVHRDVTPDNVLVGASGTAYLIDFGIAKAARRLTRTTAGAMKGKLPYMAPEQLRQQEVDHRADLFSVAVVLHEALSGERLFRARDDGDVLLAVLIAEIPRLAGRVAGVPPALDAVLERALERSPDDRYPGAMELRTALVRAVAPAEPDEVARLVERLAGDVLARRRAEIAARLSAGLRAGDGLLSSGAPMPDATTTAPPSDRTFYAVNALLSTGALAFLAYILLLRGGTPESGADLRFLPAVNAGLNATAAALLTAGYVAIRRGARRLHKQCMIAAFIASSLFLVCYVVYHYVHGDTKFQGDPTVRIVYLVILASHVLLSMAVVPLALSAFYFAFRGSFAKHKKVTRWALPIWLYVSVTGVVIYFLLRGSAPAVP